MSTFPFDQPQREPTPPAPQPMEGDTRDEPPFGGPPRAAPAVDVVDNTTEIWAFVDLPGFTEEEIDVRGDQHSLVISADRPAEVEAGRRVVLHERATHVERTIQLPAPVDVGDAVATFEDGVCKVTLPKVAAGRYEEIAFQST